MLREEVIEVCRRSVVRASGTEKKFCSTLPCSSRAAPLCRGGPFRGFGNMYPSHHQKAIPIGASPFVLREEVIEVCRRSVVRASGTEKKFCSTLPCSSRAAPLCRGPLQGFRQYLLSSHHQKAIPIGASPFVLREEVIEVCRRSVVRASGTEKKFCSTLPCSSRAAPLCRGGPFRGFGNMYPSHHQTAPAWVPLRRRSRSPLPLRRHAAWLFGTSPARLPWPSLPKHPPDRFLSATDAPRKSENGTP